MATTAENNAKFKAKNARRRETKASMKPEVYRKLRAFRRGKFPVMINEKPIWAEGGSYRNHEQVDAIITGGK